MLQNVMQGIRFWQISHNETCNRKITSDLELGIEEHNPGQVK